MRKLQTRDCQNPECAATFQAWPSQPRKYCSQACSWSAAGRRLRLKPKMCHYCGTTYQPTNAGQKWCPDCTGGGKAEQARLRRYNLSLRDWEAMKARYDGRCWICRHEPASTVDHNHKTGKVRGATCRVCNMVLHYVERDDWWDKARAYLAAAEGEI